MLPSEATSQGLSSVQAWPCSLAVLLMPTICRLVLSMIGEPDVPSMVWQVEFGYR